MKEIILLEVLNIILIGLFYVIVEFHIVELEDKIEDKIKQAQEQK